MQYQVVLTRGDQSEVYGTYASLEAAGDIALIQAQAGYYHVTVVPVSK